MPRTLHRIALAVLALLATTPAAALTIEFDYSYDGGFFSGANEIRRGYLQDAGDYVASRLGDSLNAIESGVVGNFFPKFSDPSYGGFFTTPGSRDIAADTLVIYTGGRAMGSDVAGRGGPGSFVPEQVAGTELNDYSAWRDNASHRGEQDNGATGSAYTSTDFGSWGGSIWFGTGLSWHFDAEPLSFEPFGGGKIDFFSVAIHEIAHVLGIGTAPSWSRLTPSYDPSCPDGRFCGAESVAAHGDNVPLAVDKDGYPDYAHWAEGTESFVANAPVEAAMDPTITAGTRKYFTNLDWAGLADIGWEVESSALLPSQQVAVVPLPAGLWLLLGAIAGLGLMGRRRHELEPRP